ncbi:MAG TPA: cation transporter, partial [bacterium]
MTTAGTQVHDTHTCHTCRPTPETRTVTQRLDLQRIELSVAGLSCAGDAAPVAARLERLPGVREAMVNPVTERAVVAFDPGVIGIEAIVQLLEERGIDVGRTVARWRLRVPGLKCASCVRRVEQAVLHVPGIYDANMNLATEMLTIEYTPKRTDLAAVRAAVRAEGFDLGPEPLRRAEAAAPSPGEANAREFRSLMHKFWFAAVVSVPTIALSYPWIFGMRDLLPRGSAILRLVWGGLGLLTLPVLLYSGGHFYKGLWAAFKHRTADMNTLIGIGIAAAWLYSTVAVLVPSLFPRGDLAEVFYDVTAVVTALVVLGQALEVKAKG